MSWLFVAPALILIAVLMYWPMVGTVIESFYSASFINPTPTFVGLGTYKRRLRRRRLRRRSSATR